MEFPDILKNLAKVYDDTVYFVKHGFGWHKKGEWTPEQQAKYEAQKSTEGKAQKVLSQFEDATEIVIYAIVGFALIYIAVKVIRNVRKR